MHTDLNTFLAELKKREVRVKADGNALRYSAPPGALTDELRKELTERKAEILQLLQQVPDKPEYIRRVSREKPIPASFSQQRLWFLAQLEPSGYRYNVPASFRLCGHLNVAHLQESVGALIDRHESLRTSFSLDEGGRVVQHVHQSGSKQPANPNGLEVVDLRGLSDSDREAEARRKAYDLGRQPFNLERGPLVRFTLLRLAADESLLLVTLHHIVSDVWSLRVLAHDLFSFYQSLQSQTSPSLEELDVQYPDFAVWQREWLEGPRLEEQLDFWKEALRKAPSLLQLPTDRPRPPVQRYHGAFTDGFIPANLANQLRSLGQQEGATLFMTMLSAFGILLSRYSGQTDIVVGTPIANRTRPELEPLIGFFANTLPMRMDMPGDPSFRDLLKRVRDTALDAYSHQDLPFERLVEELKPDRDLSHNPLFQVMFVMQNAPDRSLPAIDGLTVQPVDYHDSAAKFDLTLYVEEQDDGITLRLEYNTDLFDAERMERMVGHYVRLLQAGIDAPDRSIAGLPILSDDEQKTFETWNDTREPFSEEACIHYLFEAQVEKTPSAIAVRHGARTATYAELNASANQFARKLQSEGVAPGQNVAICIERSKEMVTAILGVLKAGGSYVPLDPGDPAERRRIMFDDSKAEVVVVDSSTRGEIDVADGTREEGGCVLEIDCNYSSYGAANLEVDAAPDERAYLLFTSGSTGRPKGVSMPHRPLVNLIEWQMRTAMVEQGDRTLQFAPLSFDVSFQEIFATLCAGGELILVDDMDRRDAQVLLRLLKAQQISRIFVPFVALNHLCKVADQTQMYPSHLKEVITAGEQLSTTPYIRNFFSALPQVTLKNQYGPTETHVVSEYVLSREPETWEPLPPIGRPIPNARLYVLDDQQQPVPAGVPGELYIGGEPLSDGYLGQPEQTARRFVPDPFQPERVRMYRTGDRVRMAENGMIEFLGRADEQVKIRGYRVEPGEVESVLNEHPSVKLSAVVVRKDASGHASLAVCIEPSIPGQADQEELTAYVKSCLPDYMIPSTWEMIDEMPRTASGKVAKGKLKDRLDAKRSASTRPRKVHTPATQIEREIADIWSGLLDIQSVGRDDNFFDLGGHSLLIVDLRRRLEQRLDTTLTIVELFQYPTVRALAQHIGSSDTPGDAFSETRSRVQKQQEAIAARRPSRR